MSDAVMLERIAARRAELDVLEEQLVKQLAEVRAVSAAPWGGTHEGGSHPMANHPVGRWGFGGGSGDQ